MFCTKCGSEVHGDKNFCAKCGAPLRGHVENRERKVYKRPDPHFMSANPSNNSLHERQAKSKRSLTGVILGVLILIGVVAAIVFLVSSHSYKAAAEKFVEGVKTQDAGKIMSSMHKKVIEVNADDLSISYDEMREGLQEILDSPKSLFGLEIDASISGYEDVDESENNQIIRNYKQKYDLKVSDVKDAKFKFFIDKGSFVGKISWNVKLVKIGLSWYVSMQNITNEIDKIVGEFIK